MFSLMFGPEWAWADGFGLTVAGGQYASMSLLVAAFALGESLNGH